MATDWRAKALQNQAAMADLHRRRTRSESAQIMRGMDAKKKQSKNRNAEARYWKRRAGTAERALAMLSKQPEPAPSVSFYESRQWKALRYRTIKLYGAKCQACNAGGLMHVDHIKPRSKYPELELRLDNLQVLCADCNLGKGAWDETDWRKGALKSIPGT